MLICGIALSPFLASLLHPPSSSSSCSCRLPVAVGNDGLVQQASSSTACLPVGGSIWSASRADEWTKHNRSTKDKSARRHCGNIYITVFFFSFLLGPKKSARVCFSHTHRLSGVQTHGGLTPLAHLNIYSGSVKEVPPTFLSFHLPLDEELCSGGGSVQPGAKPERRDVNIIAALRAASAACRATRGGKVLKKEKWLARGRL